jgi:hypothetical protein
LVVFAREMEAELTDAALGLFDKMMGRVFRLGATSAWSFSSGGSGKWPPSPPPANCLRR